MSHSFAPLSWQDGGALSSLLAAEAAGFPSTEDHALWREWTLARLMLGELAFWAVRAATGEVLAGFLCEGRAGHLSIERVMGEPDDAMLAGLLAAMKGPASSILIEEAAGHNWVSRAGQAGLHSFARQAFSVDLTLRAYPAEAPGEGLVLRPWDTGDRPGVIPLLARANAGTLNGLFLTRPDPTTEASCARALDALLAGESGEFLPWASFVVVEGDRPLGVILVVRETDGLPNVFELAVLPDAQGRRLPRLLTVAVRHAVLAHGHTQLHLATTTENRAVHRMFHDDEVAHFSWRWGAYWLREARHKPRRVQP